VLLTTTATDRETVRAALRWTAAGGHGPVPGALPLALSQRALSQHGARGGGGPPRSAGAGPQAVRAVQRPEGRADYFCNVRPRRAVSHGYVQNREETISTTSARDHAAR